MWAKVDDGWWCHPKVMGLSGAACGLWIRALSWSCHQRRATVPSSFLVLAKGSNDEANELVAAGLWHEEDDGWRIHDWDDYQQKSLSEKRAEAGRKGGKKSGEVRRERSNMQASDEAGTRPDPARPNQGLRPGELSPTYDHQDAEYRARKAEIEAVPPATVEQREAALRVVKNPTDALSDEGTEPHGFSSGRAS